MGHLEAGRSLCRAVERRRFKPLREKFGQFFLNHCAKATRNMITIYLSDETKRELNRRLCQPVLNPAMRDRIHILLYRSRGDSPPRVASQLGRSVRFVRWVLKEFQKRGLGILEMQSTGRGPGRPHDPNHRRMIEASIVRLLRAQGGRWSSDRLRQALASEGIRLSSRQVRRYLKDLGVPCRRGLGIVATPR